MPIRTQKLGAILYAVDRFAGKSLEPVLTVEKAKQSDLEEVNVTEQLFHSQFKEDAMATEKLDEGIASSKMM
ncbi:hypothetical protein M3Y98_01108600 [Aphelenchoides besseyi]|nr:hypothetical protein M3Y98_01108600 [Aphelenchoides besseyi]